MAVMTTVDINWLNNTITEQYSLVRAYKNNEDTKVLRYRHKSLKRDIILIEHKGTGEVYELLKRQCQQVKIPQQSAQK